MIEMSLKKHVIIIVILCLLAAPSELFAHKNTDQENISEYLYEYIISRYIPESTREYFKKQLEQQVALNVKAYQCSAEFTLQKPVFLYASVIAGKFRIVWFDTELLSDTQKEYMYNLVLDSAIQIMTSLLSEDDLIGLELSLSEIVAGSLDWRESLNCPALFEFMFRTELNQRKVALSHKEYLSGRVQQKQKILEVIIHCLQQYEDEDIQGIFQDRVAVLTPSYNEIKQALSLFMACRGRGLLCQSEDYLCNVDNLPLIQYIKYLASQDGSNLDVPVRKKTHPPGNISKQSVSSLHMKQEHSSSTQDQGSQGRQDFGASKDGQDNDQRGGSGGRDNSDPPPSRCSPERVMFLFEKPYEDLVDEFMDLPRDSFLIPPEWFQLAMAEGRSKINEPKRNCLAEAVLTLLQEGDGFSEKAKKLFSRAKPEDHDKGCFNAKEHLIAWLIMYKYYLIYTSQATDIDIEECHYYFNRSQTHPETLPLQILYAGGILNGLEGHLDIERFRVLMKDEMKKISQNASQYYHFFVSFTQFDLLRWVTISRDILNDFNFSTITGSVSGSLYFLFLHDLEWESGQNILDCRYLNIFKENDYIPTIYPLINQVWTHQANPNPSVWKDVCNPIKGKGSTHRTYTDTLEEFLDKMLKCELGENNRFEKELLSSIVYQLCAIVEEYGNRKHDRLRATKIVNWYKKSAEVYPSQWKKVFTVVSGIEKPIDSVRDETIKAAEKLSEFWEGKNKNIVNYWEYRKDKLVELKQYQPERSSINIENAKAIALKNAAALIAEEEEKNKNETKPFRAKNSKVKKKSKTEQPPIQSDNDTIDDTTVVNGTQSYTQAETAVLTRKSDIRLPVNKAGQRLPLPIIQSTKTSSNRSDSSRLTSDWQLKGGGQNIRPHERILRKYWSREVIQAMDRVMDARCNNSPDDEFDAYYHLLSVKKKTCAIGIERVWEEIAWMLLHQYDGAFAAGFLIGDHSVKEAREASKTARQGYLFPAIAMLMGYDEITSEIPPDSLFQSIRRTIDSGELTPDELKTYVYRMRCLFSSVGHTYSLFAMTEKRGIKSGDLARRWYSNAYNLFDIEMALTKEIEQNNKRSSGKKKGKKQRK